MSAKAKTTIETITIDESVALTILPHREVGAHKWSVGGVIIVGGSPGYIGAPALAALGASRSGAGIVLIASPRGAVGSIASIVPEAAFIPMPEGDLGGGGRRAAEKIDERLEKAKALVIGPGLGDDEYADLVMTALLGKQVAHQQASLGFSAPKAEISPARANSDAILGQDKPAVIDADALNWLATQDEWWKLLNPHTCVLTPHLGEMARLTGKDIADIEADVIGVAVAAAKEWQQIVVLKGSPTIATDGERVYVAESSPRSLATAGTGDVLAGSIGAFLAQGVASLEAASIAIFIGCRAAARLTERFGTLGVIATDLPPAMAEELGTLELRKVESNG
jgi:NAD(P)H-hydrate epimerase